MPLIDEYEDRAVVALRHNRRYLSCRNDPYQSHGTGVDLITRGHCHEWEHFRLYKNSDGTISLQNMGGGFISPTNGAARSPWVRRPQGAWERLHVTEVRGADGRIHVHSMIDGRPCYLTIDEEGSVTVSETNSTSWRILLAKVPTFNVAGLGLTDNGCHWSDMEQNAFQCACPRDQYFVRKVLRALKEVGAFYIVGHGVSSDLFDSIMQAYGHLPWKDDAEETDGNFKINHLLKDNREGLGRNNVQRIAERSGVPVEVLNGLTNEYFEKAEVLSHNLLHVMAVAYGLVTGNFNPAWRGAWRDGDRYIGLRALYYHPGPRMKRNGTTVRTTARHTDATWLTLLRNDDCDGLWIATERGDSKVVPPTANALLVNTGNVMKTATTPQGGGQSFYNAVCHWVERTEKTESHTRISMPFFYDRNAGATFYGDGTGGC